MTEQAPLFDSNWKERVKHLSERSAEDELLDTVGAAMYNYAQKKSEEAKAWEKAYYEEKAQKEYMMKLLAQNGIAVPDFSSGIPPSVPMIAMKNTKVKEKQFKDLIQSEDKKNVLFRLHKRIDGFGGKEVALILLKAKAEKLISKLPSEKEFRTEFKNITGKWRSISHFFSPSCSPTPDISVVTI